MPNKNQTPKIINPQNQNGGRVEALVRCYFVTNIYAYIQSTKRKIKEPITKIIKALESHLSLLIYFGVSVPSGLLNPLGKSSSIVATKPFIINADATMIKLGQ